MAQIVVSTDNITATTTNNTCIATYSDSGSSTNSKLALSSGSLKADLTVTGDVTASGTGSDITLSTRQEALSSTTEIVVKDITVGSTSSDNSGELTLINSTTAGGGASETVILSVTSTTDHTLAIKDEGGTAVGVTALSFTSSSDRTLKDNIVAFDDAAALNKVLQMNAHSFVMKSEPDVPRCGVIAQEMAEVAPELVVETGNGTLAVNYSDLTAYLLSANKALHAQNEALFARVEALEARMA